MKLHQLAVTLFMCGLVACVPKAEDVVAKPETAPATEQTILELMLTLVVPASDTLWGIDDPQTDADWQVFVDAADITIAAFQQAKKGGAGPNDAVWVADPKWQAYSDEVIAAAESAKVAIAARNMDAIYEAGDALYQPCEACHIDFNPGVPGEEVTY